MERLSLTLPALYGDHHVVAVRRVLDALPGVSEIRVTPASHAVSLRFDPARQTAAGIEAALAAAGYRTGDPEREFASAGPAAPRHTAVAAGTLSFSHEPPAWEGRPLWPCPGFDRTPIPEN
jgi:copper chaperone CopZ